MRKQLGVFYSLEAAPPLGGLKEPYRYILGCPGINREVNSGIVKIHLLAN